MRRQRHAWRVQSGPHRLHTGIAGRGKALWRFAQNTGHQQHIDVFEHIRQQRAALLESRLLEVQGQLQREGDVQHVIAQRLTNLSPMLGDLVVASRNFH